MNVGQVSSLSHLWDWNSSQECVSWISRISTSWPEILNISKIFQYFEILDIYIPSAISGNQKNELYPQAESYLRDSLSKSSPIQVKGWTATRLDTSTSWTSWVEASTISLELAWTYGSNWEEDGKKYISDNLSNLGNSFELVSHKSNLIYSKCHNYIRLLVNDFSFASWVTQICLHLKKSKHDTLANILKVQMKVATGENEKKRPGA